VLALRTPEAWEKQDIWRYLDSLPNCWYVKPMTFGYGKSGVPDILACLDGKFVSIEVKRHGKGATATQKRRMEAVSAAGGTAFWGTADKVIKELSDWKKSQDREYLHQRAFHP
jgi:hypothetical protein